MAEVLFLMTIMAALSAVLAVAAVSRVRGNEYLELTEVGCASTDVRDVIGD